MLIITCVLGPFLTTCGTIDFLVDDYLGPFFITVGTIGRTFFVFLLGYIQKLFKLTKSNANKREGFRPAAGTKGEDRYNCV